MGATTECADATTAQQIELYDTISTALTIVTECWLYLCKKKKHFKKTEKPFTEISFEVLGEGVPN